jgi:hypothetical protein
VRGLFPSMSSSSISSSRLKKGTEGRHVDLIIGAELFVLSHGLIVDVL